jgi:AcrR family transcriptional regulator
LPEADTIADEHEHEGNGRRARRREPLSRARIVEAALRIMDEEGLDAVTMRRVGRELGVEAMSLYNHVADKEDILAGITQAVMAGFVYPPEDPDWRETARRTARAWRQLLKAHPNVITLMSHQRKPMTSIEALRPMEHALEILGRAGLSPRESVRAFRAFGGYIQGFVLAEIANMFGGEQTEVRPEDIARTLPLEELPTLAVHLEHLFRCDLDAEFEYGLDLMIRGLEAKASSEDADATTDG